MIGGTSRDGDGQRRHALYASVYWSSDVHWRSVNGANVPAGSRRSAAWYCRARTAGGGGPAEQLHVVGAADGEVQPVAELGQRVVGVVEAQRQRGQPQQRRRVVPGHQGPPGRVQVPVDDRVEAGVVDQVHQGQHGHGEAAPGAVGQHGLAGDRRAGEPRRQRTDPGPGTTAAPGCRRAGRRQAAGLLERAPGRDHGGRVPRIQAEHLVGGVQRHRPQLAGVAGGEDLREPASVGVAVQIHPAQVQRPHDAGHVPGRVGGVEQVRGVHPAAAAVVPGVVEPPAAVSHQAVEPLPVLLTPGVLQARAVDRGGVAGAAEVDQQQVPGPLQCPHHRQVGTLRSGRGESGPALHGQHGPGRVPAGRQPAEPDADPGARRGGVVQRHHEVPAVRPWPFRARLQRDAAQPQRRSPRCRGGSRRGGGNRGAGHRRSGRQRSGTQNSRNGSANHTEIVGRGVPGGQALVRSVPRTVLLLVLSGQSARLRRTQVLVAAGPSHRSALAGGRPARADRPIEGDARAARAAGLLSGDGFRFACFGAPRGGTVSRCRAVRCRCRWRQTRSLTRVPGPYWPRYRLQLKRSRIRLRRSAGASRSATPARG